MYIKQINTRKALKLASNGEDIMVMVSRDGGTNWMDYEPVMLSDMLDGCMFFQQDNLDLCEHTNRKNLDMGKILALKKAGWSNAKIADEMGVSDRTICNRLREQ